MKVRIARAAINDLVEIERHISRDNPAAARRQVAALFDRCHSLAHNPMRYPTTPIAGLRRRPHRSYLIFYRVTGDVEIIRILHAARDWTYLLATDDD